MVHVITEVNEFDKKLDEAGDKLVVVDFSANWCGPCNNIAPFFKELSEEYTNVIFLKVDIDAIEDLAIKYDVSSIPKFIFIKNKKQVADMLGSNQEKLKNLVVEFAT